MKSKVLLLLCLVLLGSLIGAVYGIINDFITFSISSEYYTEFKFSQFGLINVPHVLGVIMVGILATWWMGGIIASIIGITGFIQKDARRMFKYSLQAFFIVIAMTILMEIIGFFVGKVLASRIVFNTVSFIPDSVKNAKDFFTVGIIHDFAYLGGFLGIPVGIWWQIKNQKNSPNELPKVPILYSNSAT